MNELQMRQAAQFDVRYWAMLHPVCPYCDLDFTKSHPATNLVPHWRGDCVEAAEIVVGPNWARKGNVDAPLADRAAQKPVQVTGKSFLKFLAVCAFWATAIGILIWMGLAAAP